MNYERGNETLTHGIQGMPARSFDGGTLEYALNQNTVARMEERIVNNPDICNGRPVIRGTRITVQTILEFLGAGDSIEEVLEEYPTLTREHVLACLRYSSRLMGNHFRLEALA